MKKSFPIFFLVVIVALSSCTSTTSIQVLKPSLVTLPAHVDTIAVVNRSRPQSKLGNTLEGILTGEGIAMDKQGAQSAVSGLTDALRDSPRVRAKATGLEYKGSGGEFFPEPIPWSEISRICEQFKTDAVAAIESYDSDSRFSYDTRTVNAKDREGNPIKRIEHIANEDVRITLGWRIYDPETKTIIDQFRDVHNMGWSERGKTRELAEARLPSKRLAVQDASYAAGRKFGTRIVPSWFRVTRYFYNTGSPSMKVAKKKAFSNDWEGASQIWRSEIHSQKRKVRGKAAYNLAVASEVQGLLDEAVDWARQSYEDHNNKRARSYINILNRRINDQRKLEEQMSGAGPEEEVQPQEGNGK